MHGTNCYYFIVLVLLQKTASNQAAKKRKVKKKRNLNKKGHTEQLPGMFQSPRALVCFSYA